MEVVQVQPRDTYLKYIYVPAKGTTLRWSFTTKRNNISFGLYRWRGKSAIAAAPEIVLRAQQQMQQRQFSAPPGELFHSDAASRHHDDEADSEMGVLVSSNTPDASGSHSNRQRAKSVASAKLKDNNMDEILPIQHYNSSHAKVEGSYVVDQPGNYVLVFDNTFSRNTAKSLTFSVALVDTPVKSKPELNQQGVSGWLSKKKRKKMQGWAKRWFHLSPAGVLSYSIEPNGVTRGSIQVVLATISSNQERRTIHIDSGTMIYHLRALSDEDYTKWTQALQSHRSGPIENTVDYETAGLSTKAVAEEANFLTADEVKQGVEGSVALTTQFERYSEDVDQLIDAVKKEAESSETNGLESTLSEIIQRLQSDKQLVQASILDQQKRWNALRLKVATDLPATKPEHLESHTEKHLSATINHNAISRHTSVHSRVSVYSDEFYDAEDIILSEGDDDDFAGEDDDNAASSDEEDGSSEIESSEKESFRLSVIGDCVRRSRLPCPAAGDVGSALAVFRKNIGKDLSTIAMPVSMNEPLNMLQRACEELEYSNILSKASTLSDSMDRLIHVAVFAVSAYASSQYRTGRKPFNPMLGETYECIRPDKGFRFISEKVSHNPLIVAAYAESKDFKYWQSTKVKSKFWGKSMEFMTEGTFHVTLTGHDDHYTYTKPSSWMRNMIAGEKYLEHAGEMRVTNHNTGEYALVTFKEGTGGGLFGAPTNRNDIIALFFDARGKKCRRVVGKWSDKLAEEVEMNKRKLSVLWTADPPGIEDYEKYYGFTRFCVELNEISDLERDKLPITDTRYRTDQRLYENGKVEEADAEKLRIEQAQRERRKEYEAKGIVWKPRWFALQPDPYADPAFMPSEGSSTPQSFQYIGHYWQTRESGTWPSDMPHLW